MKDYDPVYIAKCIQEDADNPRKQAMFEKLSNKRAPVAIQPLPIPDRDPPKKTDRDITYLFV